MTSPDHANKLSSWDKIVSETEDKLKKDTELMRRTITIAVVYVLLSTISLSIIVLHSAPALIYASTLGEAQEQPIFEDVELFETILQPSIAIGAGSQGYDKITIEGLENAGEPGQPVLPVKTIKVLVPYGAEVQGIKVTGKKKTRIDGNYTIEPGQEPVPLSYTGEIKVTKPNPSAYDSDSPYPEKTHKKFGTYTLTGYDILILELNPIEYIPKKGEISYYQTMEVKVSFKAVKDKNKNLRYLTKDAKTVANFIDNPDTLETYQTTYEETTYSTAGSVNPSESYTYIIITNAALKESFQPLVDWKKTRSRNPITATTVLVEDIVGNPAYWCDGTWGDSCGTGNQFNDSAAKIRNFIKDAYNNWETEYVLLGGDDEIIPVRYLFDFNYTSRPALYSQIPGDTYYASLDGNWDNDGDGVWGEKSHKTSYQTTFGSNGEEADLYAEVSIGRAPVETPAETINFVSKTIAYEQATIEKHSYLDKAMMVGQKLDELTYGGDSKDLVANMLAQYTITKLYDRDSTFSATAVKTEIDNGVHIINHFGHASHYGVMGLYRDFSLDNTEYCLIYSEGCLTTAFDQAMSGDKEAISELLVIDKNGAFAFIGNSRYGGYLPGSTDGPGNIYDRSFFDALVNERITSVGAALKDSKEDLLGAGFYRWLHYTLNLLGDPETSIDLLLQKPPCQDKGDYNQDGYITQEDIEGCSNVYRGLENHTDRCDVNTNQGIDWGDIVVIQYYVNELTDTFPICENGTTTTTTTTSTTTTTTTTSTTTTTTTTTTSTTSTTQSSCSDTDGGLNYAVKGTLNSKNLGTKTDYCSTSKKVVEYYCSGGLGYSKKYTCPKGCADGACK